DSGGSQHLNHRLEQRTLSALISVPSGWRSLELDVSWCWKSLRDLRPKKRAKLVQNKCNKDNEKTYNLRLPGSVRDVSRKLGIEVVEEPYLRTRWDQTLEVGRSGRIILKGGLLWRSTKVTLGTQLADKIEVLPDMSGLIVEFDCVERPAGWPSEYQRLYRPVAQQGESDAKAQQSQAPATTPISVRVWTSEGDAQGYDVVLRAFNSEIGEPPCYARRLLTDPLLANRKGTTIEGDLAKLAAAYEKMYVNQVQKKVQKEERNGGQNVAGGGDSAGSATQASGEDGGAETPSQDTALAESDPDDAAQ
ncbi:MAG TPA: hypothetical protein VKN76_02450, partial [Kiloniellaceae bacterium]|nr:hypothetical protein [Kiloniellaceae bacterium]